MRLLKNQRGFSLFEMVIVIGIVAILAGTSLNLIGQLRTANVEKTTKSLSDQITKVQIKSMSKADKPYLFLCMAGGRLYSYITTANSSDATTIMSNGIDLGAGLTVNFYNDQDATPLIGTLNSDPVRISFLRSGKLDTIVFNSLNVQMNRITIVGERAIPKQIRFNIFTGKHITEGAD